MRITKRQLKKIIYEALELDLEIGDVILTGKFKNKRKVVKDLSKDDLGQPTVNGMKVLNFRIEKLMPKDKWSKQSKEALEFAKEVNEMKITKRQLRKIIREEKRRMRECEHMGDNMSMEPVVSVEDVPVTIEESQSPEGELVVEMEMASRNLELAVESINAAALLCPSCVQEVAAAAPLMEAMVSQAEALQETLDAVGVVVSESTEFNFTGDVAELPGIEAFGIGHAAGMQGL